jgi:serine/threonine protein kinase
MREALRIMRDVARAVHYAHRMGIYHRDLKPSNIIVTHDGKPCIADFGLAKVVHIGDAAYVKGVIMGTPYYMPPEQAEGDMEKVDDLSDVYSLGAVAYEAVTGVSPYAERSPDTVIDLLPNTPPEPPQRVRADLPEGVAAIIQKAMRKDKKQRYPSADAFADDIDRYLAGKPLAPEPLGARPGGSLERFAARLKSLWT